MSEVVDRWEGKQSGFAASGRTWTVHIRPKPNTTDVIAKGQEVIVLTPEGLAEVERAAAEKALTEAADVVDAESVVWVADYLSPGGGAYWDTSEWLRARAAAYRREGA